MHIYMHACAHMRTHPLEFEISWESSDLLVLYFPLEPTLEAQGVI